jgi:hypothetical protein
VRAAPAYSRSHFARLGQPELAGHHVADRALIDFTAFATPLDAAGAGVDELDDREQVRGRVTEFLLTFHAASGERRRGFDPLACAGYLGNRMYDELFDRALAQTLQEPDIDDGLTRLEDLREPSPRQALAEHLRRRREQIESAAAEDLIRLEQANRLLAEVIARAVDDVLATEPVLRATVEEERRRADRAAAELDRVSRDAEAALESAPPRWRRGASQASARPAAAPVRSPKSREAQPLGARASAQGVRRTPSGARTAARPHP